MVNSKFALLGGAIVLTALWVAACGPPGSVNEPVSVQENPSWSASGAAVSGPKAIFREQSVNMGPVPLDTWIEFAYTLRNVGDQPLLILEPPRARALEGC